MSGGEQAFLAHRAERDAALRLFRADLATVRADLRQRGVAGRIADRVGDGAMDLTEDALEYVDANKGVVAAAIAAVVLWFARNPILDSLGSIFADHNMTEPERLADRLRSWNPFSRE